MKKDYKRLFDFEKKVIDALLVDGAVEFLEIAGKDLEKTQDFLRNKVEKLKELYEESLGL